MSIYTVELITPKLDHVVKLDIEAKTFSGAEKEAKKQYDWAKPVTVKSIRLNEDPDASYGDKVQFIPLTGDQKNDLYCYILMTTKSREEERDAWELLSKELDDQGKPEFPNAASNYSFWVDMIKKLETISHILENV